MERLQDRRAWPIRCRRGNALGFAAAVVLVDRAAVTVAAFVATENKMTMIFRAVRRASPTLLLPQVSPPLLLLRLRPTLPCSLLLGSCRARCCDCLCSTRGVARGHRYPRHSLQKPSRGCRENNSGEAGEEVRGRGSEDNIPRINSGKYAREPSSNL